MYKRETRLENGKVDSGKCPVQPLKPRPALETSVKWQPHQERTGYFWKYKRSVKYTLSSSGGVIIWPSFPVPAEVLTVELGNFPESRINGGSFRFRVWTFRSALRGRIKVYSIGFQKGELKPLLCEYGATKCKCMPFFAWILEPFSRQVRWLIWLHSPTLSFSYTLLG